MGVQVCEMFYQGTSTLKWQGILFSKQSGMLGCTRHKKSGNTSFLLHLIDDLWSVVSGTHTNYNLLSLIVLSIMLQMHGVSSGICQTNKMPFHASLLYLNPIMSTFLGIFQLIFHPSLSSKYIWHHI